MPTIDIGICLHTSYSLNNIKELENIILVSLKTLFPRKDIKFESAYLYDDENDSGMEIFILIDSLQKIISSKLYNRITFTVNGENCFVIVGFIENNITIEVNIDYNFIFNISQKEKSGELIDFLKHNFCILYKEIKYKFAFADFDSEFEYSYSQLLKMIHTNNIPYCLLFINDNGNLMHYMSQYDLLGCEIIK